MQYFRTKKGLAHEYPEVTKELRKVRKSEIGYLIANVQCDLCYIEFTVVVPIPTKFPVRCPMCYHGHAYITD